MAKHKGLTAREKKFADLFIQYNNASKAAMEAGYSKNYAYAKSYALLEKDGIKEYIANRMAEIDASRLASIKEIQEFRTRVVRNEEKDQFGLDLSVVDRLKAADALEKTIKIQEDENEKKASLHSTIIFHTDLDIISDNFHSLFRDFRNDKYSTYILRGGRGSTKSSCASLLIEEYLKNHKDACALVIRKTANTLRDSVYAQMQWALDKNIETSPWQFNADEWDCKLSPLEFFNKKTQQQIFFRGCDDPLKLKSIKPKNGKSIQMLWIEECDQLSPEEIRSIRQSAIRGTDKSVVILSFNPPRSAANWMNKYVRQIESDEKLKKDFYIHSSNYLQVPPEWLGTAFIENAEIEKQMNEKAYRNEFLGEVVGDGANVFDNLEIRPITDDEINTLDWKYYGIDAGWYPDPTNFIACAYDSSTRTLYLFDEYRAVKTREADVAAELMENHNVDGATDLICESNPPVFTVNLQNAGLLQARPVRKDHTVVPSFRWLQGLQKIVIDPVKCPFAAQEFEEYEYERDKDGNILSGYPDKNNHSIDATRYALSRRMKDGY